MDLMIADSSMRSSQSLLIFFMKLVMSFVRSGCPMRALMNFCEDQARQGDVLVVKQIFSHKTQGDHEMACFEREVVKGQGVCTTG